MNEAKKKADIKKFDSKEFELPETLYVRDVENRVFQGIVLQCLSKVEGIALVEGNFIDNIFGRTPLEIYKGIHIEQDSKSHSVGIKVAVNIYYGFSIPEKAEEIQGLISDEVTKLTGLHVSYVHVVFKNIVLTDLQKKGMKGLETISPVVLGSDIEEEYSDEF